MSVSVVISSTEYLVQSQARLGIDEFGERELVPVAFVVNGHQNEAGEELNTLTILVDAVARGLTVGQALNSFGEIYIAAVMFPSVTIHPNIRALMREDLNVLVTNVVNFHGQRIVEKSQPMKID